MAGIGASSVGAAAVFSNPGALFASWAALSPVQQEDLGSMDQMHADGVQKFLDNAGKDENFWRKPLDYKMDGDVKVFDLVAQDIQWETDPGTTFPAMAYNGLVPG